jgi:hypothetical protein
MPHLISISYAYYYFHSFCIIFLYPSYLFGSLCSGVPGLTSPLFSIDYVMIWVYAPIASMLVFLSNKGLLIDSYDERLKSQDTSSLLFTWKLLHGASSGTQRTCPIWSGVWNLSFDITPRRAIETCLSYDHQPLESGSFARFVGLIIKKSRFCGLYIECQACTTHLSIFCGVCCYVWLHTVRVTYSSVKQMTAGDVRVVVSGTAELALKHGFFLCAGRRLIATSGPTQPWTPIPRHECWWFGLVSQVISWVSEP